MAPQRKANRELTLEEPEQRQNPALRSLSDSSQFLLAAIAGTAPSHLPQSMGEAQETGEGWGNRSKCHLAREVADHFAIVKMQNLLAHQLIILMPLACDHYHVADAREAQGDRNRTATIRLD